MCAVGSPTTERVTQYVGEQGKENRWPEDQPRGGAQDAQRPQPTWSSSKRGLEVVTGERLEIERLTSRSEEGRWKSTHRGNSLAAYPTHFLQSCQHAGRVLDEHSPHTTAPRLWGRVSRGTAAHRTALCEALVTGARRPSWHVEYAPAPYLWRCAARLSRVG